MHQSGSQTHVHRTYMVSLHTMLQKSQARESQETPKGQLTLSADTPLEG
jgi:hypothetical protein